MSLKLSKKIHTVARIHLGMSIILATITMLSAIYLPSEIMLKISLSTAGFWSFTWGWYMGLKDLKKDYVKIMKKGLEDCE